MKIGITGHQERDGADWSWARAQILKILSKHSPTIGYSSLAAGADQLFAKCVLETGGKLMAVIPMPSYRSKFDTQHVPEFDRLLALSDRIDLNSKKTDEEAFLAAGKWISSNCDLMIAVWDGEAAEGKGGTADIVEYSVKNSRAVYHVNPIEKITTLM